MLVMVKYPIAEKLRQKKSITAYKKNLPFD